MRLILLLVVLFGCFYFNEAKHTLYVENIFPNYNDWVVINELAVDDFSIKTLNVGTLNVNSADGVNIITSKSISLYGASVNFGGSNVSVSTTSPDSVVNINGAAALDVYSHTATFSSQEGDVRFEALTDFELISNDDLNGEYTGSFAVNGNILEFQASKGGSHILSHANFISHATTTSADAGNLIRFDTTDFFVHANLAIDIFAGKFVGNVNDFQLTARRNNLLLQTGTILEVGGTTVDIYAVDLFTMTSLESQVLLSSGAGTLFSASNSFKIYSDSEVTFNSFNDNLEILAGNSLSFYANEGVTIQAIQLMEISSETIQATAESIVAGTTYGNIEYEFLQFQLNAFNNVNFYAQRNLQFISEDDFTLQADASVDLNANRGTLSLAQSSSNPTTGTIQFDTTFHNILSGTSVHFGVDDSVFDVPSGNFRVATSQEDRDSEINVDIRQQFTAQTDLFLVAGGNIKVDAEDLLLDSSSDIRFTATMFPSATIMLSSYTQLDSATRDISFNGGSFLASAGNELQFQSGVYFTQNSDSNIEFIAVNDLNFNVLSNMTIDTHFDANYKSRDGIQIGDSILEQFAINSGYTQIYASESLQSFATENITVVGSNVNFNADGDMSIDSMTYNSVANRFSVLSGSQSYTYDSVQFTSQNSLFQSLPNQDISIYSDELSVEGDTKFIARSFSSSGDDISFHTASTLSIRSIEEGSIDIGADVAQFDSDVFRAETDQDFFLSASTLNVTATEIYSSSNDITYEVEGTFDHSSDTANYETYGSFSSYSEDTTTISASSQSLSAENIDYVSLFGNNEFTVDGKVSFVGSAWSNFEVLADRENLFESTNALTLSSKELQIKGNLEVSADGEVSYEATEDLVFFGSDFNIASFGSLTLTTPELLTIKSTVIQFSSGAEFELSSSEPIELISGLDKDLEIKSTSPTSLFTIQAEDLLVNSNNDLHISADVFTHTASGLDTFQNSILLETSAMSAGIFISADIFTGTVADNILWVVDDITNRGGDDITVAASESISFIVENGGGTNVIYPVPELANSLEDGIFFYASGSEYDPILGTSVGILYRTEGKKASAGVGSVIVASVEDIYYNSEVFNEIISHNSDVLFSTTDFDILFLVGGDLSIEADRSSASYESGDSTSITVGQTVHIQNSAGTSTLSRDGTFFTASGDFEAIADRGGVSFELVGSSLEMQTKAGLVNLEGGGKGFFTYNTDTYVAASVSLYAHSTASFAGETQSVNARNVYYESSINNNINVASTSSAIDATAGNIDLSAGLDHTFSTGTDSTFDAESDVSFRSAGSFQYVAQENLKILSVANQIYAAKAHAYFESNGFINIGEDTVSSPLVTIYAGGNSLRSGVELTSNQDFIFATDIDNTIASRNFHSTSEFQSEITTEGSLTLQATGTNGIGKDIFFTAGESLNLNSASNMNLNAKTLKFEYDDLSVSTNSNLLLKATKGISVSGSSFSTKSNTHTLNSQSLTISADADAEFVAGTALTFVSKTTASWQSRDEIELNAGVTMDIFSSGTNAPISLNTKGHRSNLKLNAEESITTTAGDSIKYTAQKGFTSVSLGYLIFTIGDSWTSTAGGDIILGANEDVTFVASNPSSVGSDFEFTSDGSMHSTIGTSFSLIADSDLAILPDVDLSFIGGNLDSEISNNTLGFIMQNKINVATGRNFNFDVTERTLFSAATFDTVALGINPDTEDGIRLSTSGEFSDIDILAHRGSVHTSAESIFINSDNAVTLRSAGTVQLLSKGANGISFSTNELPTPIISVSRGGLSLVGEDLVNLQAYSSDNAAGYIDIRATGYANLGEVNPLINGTFGIGFFSAQSSIDVSVAEAKFRMEDLRHFLATPSVEGYLKIQADGKTVDGVGINVESTIISVFAELNVAFEAANIHFFDYGINLYDYDSGVIAPTNALFDRPTISSAKDQTYVAYGRNAHGNGIELTTSTPNAPILFRTGYINLYSGGSVLIEGEAGSYFRSIYDTYITSHKTVVIQGDGLNSDIGIYLTTNHDGVLSGTDLLGSNIEFSADFDYYMRTAGKIISEATSLVFVSGNQGVIHLDLSEGALFDSPVGDLEFFGGDFEVNSNAEITFSSESIFIDAASDAEFTAKGNIIIGDPTILKQDFNIVNNIGVGVQIVGDEINLESPYIDITNGAQLEIPRAIDDLPPCNAGQNGRTLILSLPTYDNLCSCVFDIRGWSTAPASGYWWICLPFTGFS